jgi:hypothetical protein
MRQFIVFNDAYFVVTSAIKDASDKGYFKNSEFIEKFTVCFAQYYFQAVNYTVTNDSRLPPAWSSVNMASGRTTTPNFVFLLMGANAHINSDLPLALLKLMGKKSAGELAKDVLKIDKILMKSGREILGMFEESNKLLDWLKRHFIFLYYRPVMYMVLYWRIKAWRSFKSISKHGAAGSGYTKSSIKIARRFLLLSRLLG